MSKKQVQRILFLAVTCIWELLGTTLALPLDCIELAKSSGILESPGNSATGSYMYNNSLDMCWKITVARDKTVLLESIYFELEAEKPCKDWLKVSDSKPGLSSAKPLCGRFNETHIESMRNILFLHFKSDSSNTLKGFKLKWTSVSNEKKCEDLINDCLKLKGDGYCEKLPTAMEWNCRKSCNMCGDSLDKNTQKKECGNPHTSVQRIFGGTDVPIHKYPWQVGLKYTDGSGYYHCGGTIINSDYILTAGHCFYSNPGSPACKLDLQPNNILQIGVGDSNQQSPFDDGFIVYAEEVSIHPKYNCSTFDYDFAVLKLEQSLEFEHHEYIAPVCLPVNDEKTYENETGTVTGWGKIDLSGYLPDVLQVTNVSILDVNCNNLEHILPTSMCAGWPGIGGKDSCQGDSGGPLMVTEGDLVVQVGVVSGGKGCGKPENPGIYSRISKVIDWIKNPTSNKYKL